MIDFNLYLITDMKLVLETRKSPSSLGETEQVQLATRYSSLVTRYLLEAIEEALKGGVKAVQLREKDLSTRELLDMAYNLKKLLTRYNAKLFINDRVDIALAVNADGVHLGASSMPVYAARKAAKGNLLVGVSTHSLEEAERAELDGADFVTLGPIYETPSKAQYGKPIGIEILKKAKDKISIPIFAIGGIKLNRVNGVLKSGAYGIALISAILSSDSIKSNAEKFMRLLK